MYYGEAFGLFPDVRKGEAAAERLRAAGFDDLDLASRDDVNENLLPGDAVQNQTSMEKTYIGTIVGLLGGAILGIAIGLLFGFAGAISGAIAGGTAGAVAGLAISDRVPGKYKRYLRRGGVRLTVRCPSGVPVEQAAQILRETGASELGVTTSTRSPMSGS